MTESERSADDRYLICEECGNEQIDMGSNVACEECGARMPEDHEVTDEH